MRGWLVILVWVGGVSALGALIVGVMHKHSCTCTEASFALNVGELSGFVSTDSGVHIILRVA